MLRRRWPAYAALPEADRAALQRTTQVLVREKHFEGCAGLTLTDEHRVLIAAQAALPLLHREHDYYPGLASILVYPANFVGRGKSAGPGGLVTESRGVRSGESWHTPGQGPGWGGPVILSWPEVLAGAARADDARNVVLHELAHQLDAESEVMEGIPRLDTRAQVDRWRAVLAHEFHRFIMMLRAAQPTAINPYGSQNPPEFFACAVEAFYETPAALREQHPALFELLQGYFGVDPARLAAQACREADHACTACA